MAAVMMLPLVALLAKDPAVPKRRLLRSYDRSWLMTGVISASGLFLVKVVPLLLE
jgi:hypothetical protein